MMVIHLNIDRLVFDGISIARRDRPALQTAVEAELARLLTEGGLNRDANVALRDVPAGQIELSGENDPARLGRQIAHAVYGGIKR